MVYIFMDVLRYVVVFACPVAICIDIYVSIVRNKRYDTIKKETDEKVRQDRDRE